MNSKHFRKRSQLMQVAVAVSVASVLVAGCGKNDTVTQAERNDSAKGVAAPSIAETKAIAEEGFIYGLPIVMVFCGSRIESVQSAV